VYVVLDHCPDSGMYIFTFVGEHANAQTYRVLAVIPCPVLSVTTVPVTGCFM
jgi:hypothetical protein